MKLTTYRTDKWLAVRREQKAQLLLAALRDFYDQHGHANLPNTWPDQNLVRWVSHQRLAYKKNVIDPEIKAEFDRMGVPRYRWEMMWDQHMVSLRRFHKQTNFSRIPSQYKYKLASFLRIVRRACVNNTLRPRHLRDLQDIGLKVPAVAILTLNDL